MANATDSRLDTFFAPYTVWVICINDAKDNCIRVMDAPLFYSNNAAHNWMMRANARGRYPSEQVANMYVRECKLTLAPSYPRY